MTLVHSHAQGATGGLSTRASYQDSRSPRDLESLNGTRRQDFRSLRDFGSLRLRVLLLTVSFLTAAAVRAADPRLTSISPPGAQRGTEVDVTLRGQRLADAQEILLYEPGIKVLGLEPIEKNANAVKAKLAIAPDCALGLHALRVRTASGISDLRTLSVGALKEITEAEPNNELESPQSIDLDVTVHGVVENEDVDYFLVQARKGERLSAEIEGLRLGDTFFDPYLAILDKDRFVLAASDDTPLVRQDAAVSTIVPEDGAYVIQVRESAFGGSGQCRYRLHVGRFPRPLAVYPPGGRPGETLQVRWLGDAAGEATETVKLPVEEDPDCGLFARDPRGIAPSPNTVRVVDLPNVLENEPNNDRASANSGQAPAALNGILQEPGDVDCFKLAAKKGQAFDVKVYARALRSPVDSVLSVRRIGGANVGSNDDSGSPDSVLRFTAPEDDEYVVAIHDHLMAGGPHYVYRIEVTPVGPSLELGLPERQQYEDIVAAVPQGNRTAFLVSAVRRDFGGDVTVELKDLPGGVSAQVLPMPADQTQVPVLLSAPEGAPLSGRLVSIQGRGQAGEQTVAGALRQRTSLIRGQNNREVWNYVADRMAAAVTEKVPLKLEIVQPKVPLVKSGSMKLRVKVARQGDFKAPVTLRMLYNPPGVSSPPTVSIPEGKDEAQIPLTANGNAAAGTWKIAVLGQAAVGGGNVTVASQLADLEVAEPFFTFTFPKVTAEQGAATTLAIEVEKNRDFPGAAKVELLGLPNEVTTETKEITQDSLQLAFAIKTTEKSPPGQHKGLVCRATVTDQGEPIVHMLGSGELRIFKPLPKKPAPKTEPSPKPAAKPKPEPAAKPLSRLEQLRLEREKANE